MHNLLPSCADGRARVDRRPLSRLAAPQETCSTTVTTAAICRPGYTATVRHVKRWQADGSGSPGRSGTPGADASWQHWTRLVQGRVGRDLQRERRAPIAGLAASTTSPARSPPGVLVQIVQAAAHPAGHH